MSWDWVWGKQALILGAAGFLWPWVFRSAADAVVRWEGEALPPPGWRTLLVSVILALLLPAVGEGLFWALGSSPVARVASMGLLGLILGLFASRQPYFHGFAACAGGLVLGVAGGLLYPFLAWPLSAVVSLTLVMAGPMLGLSSPAQARWKKMISGSTATAWRGRIG